MDLIVEQLDTKLHDRNSFDSGVEELNDFLKKHANQNQAKNISKTYVAIVAVSATNPSKIYGYYTLSASHVLSEQLPETTKAKLPNYPIPIARVGKLAVDKNFKRKGIGSFLLHDAFLKVLSIADKMGVFAVVVDAKNEEAKTFYKRYGFSELTDCALTLFLPLATVKTASSSELAAAI